MDDRVKKAFDFAQDVTKQLVTLATGILTLTITFADKFELLGRKELRWLVTSAWISFLVSIVFGIATLMSLTGQIGNASESNPNIYAGTVRALSILQIVGFLAGLGFIIYFGTKAG